MIPIWTTNEQLSQHILNCQKWLLSYDSIPKLEMSQSLRLDDSWREFPKKKEGFGKHRSVICDIDTIECAGCSSEIPACDCFEAVSNPFCISRCMLVCPNCKVALE